MSKDYVSDGLKVAKFHADQLDTLSSMQLEQMESLSTAVESSEEMLKSLGVSLPDRKNSSAGSTFANIANDHATLSWEQILENANKAIPNKVSFSDVLTENEINCVLERHAMIGSDLSWFQSLDRYDLALSVSSGILSGLIDIFLVQVPAHSGFLGSEASDGGWLSNKVNELFGEVLPEDTVKELESLYKVPFDPSTSANLEEKVLGLGPRTHRYQSLGHDPILGFIFGVKDLLCGEFTAIDKLGNVIVQQTSTPFLEGESFIVRLLEAFKTVGGHLLSDVNTAAGLPAPLMPLLSFFQFGTIGDKGYTIAEVARQMYRSGYDFRHFIASSVPVAISEFIVRVGYVIRQINSGLSLKEAIPNASNPKLRRQLLITHAVAGLMNAGKVTVTQNPLSLSWPLVLAILRYAIPEAIYLLYGQEHARSKLVETEILNGYDNIISDLDSQRLQLPHLKI